MSRDGSVFKTVLGLAAAVCFLSGAAYGAGDETKPAAPRAASPETPKGAEAREPAAAQEAQKPAEPERRLLFDALLADPRWPHFGGSWQYYIANDPLRNCGAANFGETFPFKDGQCLGGEWQVAIQTGVFAVFDLDAASMDLINADYRFGIPLGYRRGRFSAIAYPFLHQSSHLGDEFLLRNKVERINLSYDEAMALVSWDACASVRIYGGGGYMYDRDPSDLKPWHVQYGVEIRGPEFPLFATPVSPVLAGDFQNRQETNWRTDISLRGGLDLTPRRKAHKWLLLLEYYHGNSPNGQFYDDIVEFVGAGLHHYF